MRVILSEAKDLLFFVSSDAVKGTGEIRSFAALTMTH
jgi:hypothetical protein